MKSGQFQKKTLQAKAEMTLTLAAWAFVRNLKSQVSPEPQNIKEKQLKQSTTLFLCTHVNTKLMVLRRMPIAD